VSNKQSNLHEEVTFGTKKSDPIRQVTS
jgi:hypothetical protein